MRYFRLEPDCFFVEGRTESAIYDVTRRRLFLLDDAAGRVLSDCERNTPVPIDSEVETFLESVEDLDLGTFYSAPFHVDKLLLKAPVEWRGIAARPPVFRKVDWTLSNRCDWNCDFCPQDGTKVIARACRTCVRGRPYDGEPLVFQEILASLDQFVAMGAKGIHIRGGNPLLDWELLLAMIRHAVGQDLTVVISTPGTGRPVPDILSLYDLGRVRLNVVLVPSMPTSASSAAHELRQAQSALLDRLRDRQLRFSLAVIVARGNRTETENLLKDVQARWGVLPGLVETSDYEPRTDVARNQDLTKRLWRWKSADDFFFRVRSSTCLFAGGEVTITGRLSPCAGIHRDLGSARIGDFGTTITSGAVQTMWQMSKDTVTPCATCALRYACADCTAVELAHADRPGTYCAYQRAKPTSAVDFTWEDPDGFVSVLRLCPVPQETAHV